MLSNSLNGKNSEIIQWEYVWMGFLYYPAGFDWMLYEVISWVTIIVLILWFYP